MKSHHQYLAAGIIAGLTFGIYFATIRPGHPWGGDFALYILQSLKNLNQYEAFSGIRMIDGIDPSWPKLFPPVFSIVLEPFVYSFGVNLEILKIPGLIFFCGFLFIEFLFFKRRMSGNQALSIMLLTAALPVFWDFKENILSDFPFLFFSFGALLFLDETANSSNNGRKTSNMILAGFAAWLAFRTRRIGLVIVPAVLISFLLTRFKYSRWMLLFLLAFSSLMLTQGEMFHGLSTVVDEYLTTDRSVAGRLQSCALGYNNMWVMSESHLLEISVFVIMGAWVAGGWLHSIRSEREIKEFFFLLYLAVLAVWPKSQEPRYFFPLVPLTFYYIFRAVSRVHAHRTGWLRRIAWMSLGFLAIAVYPIGFLSLDLSQIRKGVHRTESRDFFEFVQSGTRPSDMFVFGKPQVMALFCKRSAVRIRGSMDDGAVWETIRHHRADYVVVCEDFSTDGKVLKPFVRHYRDRFEIVFSNDLFDVFRLKDDGVNMDLHQSGQKDAGGHR